MVAAVRTGARRSPWPCTTSGRFVLTIERSAQAAFTASVGRVLSFGKRQYGWCTQPSSNRRRAGRKQHLEPSLAQTLDQPLNDDLHSANAVIG